MTMTTEQHEPMERRELEHVQAGCLDKAMVDKMNAAKQEGRGQDPTNIDVSGGASPPLGSHQPSAEQKRRGHGVGPL